MATLVLLIGSFILGLQRLGGVSRAQEGADGRTDQQGEGRATGLHAEIPGEGALDIAEIEVEELDQPVADYGGRVVIVIAVFVVLLTFLATIWAGQRRHHDELPPLDAVPPSKTAEFFGFFNMVGKFATIFGPLLIAFTPKLIPGADERDGILSLSILFVVGGFLLSRVNVEEGIAAAREADA